MTHMPLNKKSYHPRAGGDPVFELNHRIPLGSRSSVCKQTHGGNDGEI